MENRWGTRISNKGIKKWWQKWQPWIYGCADALTNTGQSSYKTLHKSNRIPLSGAREIKVKWLPCPCLIWVDPWTTYSPLSTARDDTIPEQRAKRKSWAKCAQVPTSKNTNKQQTTKKNFSSDISVHIGKEFKANRNLWGPIKSPSKFHHSMTYLFNLTPGSSCMSS